MDLPLQHAVRKWGLIVIFIQLSLYAQAQDHTFNSWFAWFNNVKFSERWGMNNDIQFRAGKDWNSSSLLLIRPGVNYYINERHTASMGYATTLVTNELSDNSRRLTEHRIWQQYIISDKLLGFSVQHRFRLEQRFLKRPDETAFAQRARYFIRGIIPVNSPLEKKFDRGLFISLQNELFFNIQNKNTLNGRFFDQNRAYLSFGYRLSPRFDLEAGYMNQFLLRNTAPNAFVHIGQIGFYSRL
ncbi:DUF2490 domain-containing protein [Parapedobacter deserti]|uniref:DUF2490 domain-containing protein n=1 Tax=Parapedobacter deserti TaxID=1912957 RepID=A0ABV7JKB1_9SPHI